MLLQSPLMATAERILAKSRPVAERGFGSTTLLDKPLRQFATSQVVRASSCRIASSLRMGCDIISCTPGHWVGRVRSLRRVFASQRITVPSWLAEASHPAVWWPTDGENPRRVTDAGLEFGRGASGHRLLLPQKGRDAPTAPRSTKKGKRRRRG